MQQIFKKTLLATALSLVMVPTVYATNGLAPTGLGQVHKGMGGAAAGNPQNTTTMMTNPAAASFVDDGFDVAGEIFQPKRTVKSKVFPGKEYTGDGVSAFFIPEAAYKKTIGKYAVGIAAYGNGGMNTDFEKATGSPAFPSPGGAGAPPAGTPIPFNATPQGLGGRTGIDLQQLFIAPTISTKLNEKHSVGISINLVAQQFQNKGLWALSPNSKYPGDFTNRGKSKAYGIGATLGWMGKLNDTVTLGASYRLETKMGKFKEYKGLFPNGGRMNVPAALTVGGSVKVSPKTTIAMDIQQIYYSDVDAIGNSSSIQKPFGSDNGPGFGWDDQTVYKIGVKTQMNPKLSVMAGYNHGASPVGPEDTFFGALTPAVVEDHLSLGFEYALSKTSAIVGSYTHTFKNEVKGDLTKRQPFDLEMEQDAIGIGFRKTF